MELLRQIPAFLLAAFFLLGLFSYTGAYAESHHTMGDGTAHHVCPPFGLAPGCVSVLEHLFHWQSSIIAVFAELVLMVLLAVVYVRLWAPYQFLWTLERLRLRSVSLSPPLAPVTARHTLAEALSNGIIHSKLH